MDVLIQAFCQYPTGEVINRMQFEGAVIREQGQKIGIVIVESKTLDDHAQADRIIQNFKSLFGGVPVVLMAKDAAGKPAFYGRQDAVKLLATIQMKAIPWRKYTINF